MPKFSKKELAIINALRKGKDLTSIIITLNTDSLTVSKIEAKYNQYLKERKRPAKTYALDDNCNIIFHGVTLYDNVYRLRGYQPAEHQRWLDIEKKALICLIRQLADEQSEESVYKMCGTITSYFMRSQDAIYQIALKLKKYW